MFIKTNNMKSNADLQKDVQDAIRWEPSLSAAEIGVIAKEGIITLTGLVDSYWKKTQAEEAARNVAGVKAVVEKIEIRFANESFKKNDNEIAAEVVNAFKWNTAVPDEKVKVKVEKGWVTLEGELEWNLQKEAANSAVSGLLGVVGVTNDITIKANIQEKIEKKNIEDALKRNWSLSAQDISVKVNGTEVILTGTVESWYQRSEAARIAWMVRGVWSVENDLVVDYAYELAD